MRPFLKGARPFPPSHQGHTYHMGLVFISLLSHLVLRKLLQSPHPTQSSALVPERWPPLTGLMLS